MYLAGVSEIPNSEISEFGTGENNAKIIIHRL